MFVYKCETIREDNTDYGSLTMTGLEEITQLCLPHNPNNPNLNAP